MTTPTCCTKCPAMRTGDDVSTDGFDRAVELFCGFTGKMIDGFYEHPGNEKCDKEVPIWCPLKN